MKASIFIGIRITRGLVFDSGEGDGTPSLGAGSLLLMFIATDFGPSDANVALSWIGRAAMLLARDPTDL